MYICICNAVTENHIEEAVRQGARRMRDLHKQLGVTAECGRCANCAHQCLKSALAEGKNGSWTQLAAQAVQSLPALNMPDMEAV